MNLLTTKQSCEFLGGMHRTTFNKHRKLGTIPEPTTSVKGEGVQQTNLYAKSDLIQARKKIAELLKSKPKKTESEKWAMFNACFKVM
ncbi:MAG: hypothetical protein JKY22_12255 [Flavobacteriaceae bacterium]|nr:hypothetical protein [Flavobacteriaceae bacterium]